MIQCNHCSKQYIGETKRRLKDRFNEDRRPVDNPSNISKPTTVSKHFRTNDHSANDITLIPLELIKSNRDRVRKAREAYLIEKGKTLEPLGMNKKDEIKYSLYFFYLLSFIYTRFIFCKVLSITTSTVFVFNVHFFFYLI